MLSENIDALRNDVLRLRKESPGRELLEALEKLFRLEYRSDPVFGEKLALEIITIATGLEKTKEIALGYRLLGVSKWARGEYSSALLAYSDSTRIYTSLGDELGAASVANNIGGIYLEQGLLDMAMERFLYALRLKERHHDYASTAYPYLNIGNIYRRLGNYAQARVCYRQALAVWQEAGDRGNMAGCYTNIGLVHSHTGELDNAMEHHRKALDIRVEMGDKRGQAISLGNIAGVLQMMGNAEEALDTYRRSLDIQEQIGDSIDTTRSRAYIGQLLTEMGRTREAESVLTEALGAAKSLGARSLEVTCLGYLSNLYENIDDLRKALDCAREEARLKSELRSERHTERLARLQAIFQTSHGGTVIDEPPDITSPGRRRT